MFLADYPGLFDVILGHKRDDSQAKQNPIACQGIGNCIFEIPLPIPQVPSGHLGVHSG